MKKIYSYALLLLAGAFAFTACSDDNDSNPTLIQPTSFVVNNPAIGSANLDLEKSATVTLTWSQPVFTNFSAPVVPTYTVEFSPTASFTQLFDASLDDNTGADYIALAETYSTGSADINTATVNRSIIEMMGWSESEVPAVLPLAVRVKAAVQDASFNEYGTIYSNVVTLNTVPYYIELKPADPEIWWLIGADIGDGSWGSDIGKCVVPMQTINGFDYDTKTGQGEIQWIGYLAGGGFKLRGSLDDGWATQWGQGASFGTFVKNDGGSGNITVPEAGVYTVTLNTKDDELTVEKYAEAAPVYSGMAIAGSFNDWSDTEMAPVHTYTGAENHDWYITTTFNAGDEVKVKQAGSWDFNKGGSFVEYGEGLYVYGVSNGDNLVIPEAATYTILFNDITGFIRFIKQ